MATPSLTQLEAFVAVLRCGSFAAAAVALGISQPAVSVRIASLERRLGVGLLVRGAPARATPEGLAALDYAERILALSEAFERQMRPRRRLRGTLRFGVSEGFALVCLAPLMRLVRERAPELLLAVSVGSSPALSRKVAEGVLDAAILSNSRAVTGLRLVALGRQDVAWVASPALGLQDTTDPAALLDRPLLTSPAPSHLHQVIMDWFATCGLTPARLGECDSVAIITSLVAAGAGASVLPMCLVARELADGRLTLPPIVPPVPAQEIVVGLPPRHDPLAAALVPIIRAAVVGTGFLA